MFLNFIFSCAPEVDRSYKYGDRYRPLIYHCVKYIKFSGKIVIQSSAVIVRLIYDDISYDTAITESERGSNIRITTNTPYLAHTGELWGVYCEDLVEK